MTHEMHENRLGTEVGTHTYRCKRIIDRVDNQRVAYPDEAGGRERCSRPSPINFSGGVIEQEKELHTNVL